MWLNLVSVFISGLKSFSRARLVAKHCSPMSCVPLIIIIFTSPISCVVVDFEDRLTVKFYIKVSVMLLGALQPACIADGSAQKVLAMPPATRKTRHFQVLCQAQCVKAKSLIHMTQAD